MTDDERRKAMNAVVRANLRGKTKLQRETRDEIVRLLKLAEQEIKTTLAGQPSKYETWSLQILAADIRRVLAEFSRAAGAEIAGAAGKAWNLGTAVAAESVAAAGVGVVGSITRISAAQLSAMRAFMVDRIGDIGRQAASNITSELGLVVIGARAPSDAIGRVTEILGEPSRTRATTIVRTEVGRVYAVAAQAQLAETATVLPNIKKKWRASGKLHPRLHHDAADGQVVAWDKPFLLRRLTVIKGDVIESDVIVKLMHPLDPAAPVGETINCGCVAVPHMDHWPEDTTAPKRPRRDGDDGTTLRDVLARMDSSESNARSAPGAA